MSQMHHFVPRETVDSTNIYTISTQTKPSFIVGPFYKWKRINMFLCQVIFNQTNSFYIFEVSANSVRKNLSRK